MIKTVKFTKMHGAGNDYIYVDTLLYSIPDPSAAAIKWSAPHTGIGGTFVSMGNPHFVTFVDDIDTIDIARYGSEMEHDAAFPQRCNIEFAQVMPDGTIRTRVWERGSGITMACGTGACATAVAAQITGRAQNKSTIKMDGGTLLIEWNADDEHVYMTGPAEFVFDGEIALP